MNREEMIARSGDSHLEQLFSAALWDAGWRHCEEPDEALAHFDEASTAWSNGLPYVARCEAIPQVKFDAGGIARVVDWVFLPHGSFFGSSLVVIELDGHAYHERTPEQASRDRAFDRAAQLGGSIVLRFTHLELTRYMPACLADLKSAIELQGGRNAEAWRSYQGSRQMAPGLLRVATGV